MIGQIWMQVLMRGVVLYCRLFPVIFNCSREVSEYWNYRWREQFWEDSFLENGFSVRRNESTIAGRMIMGKIENWTTLSSNFLSPYLFFPRDEMIGETKGLIVFKLIYRTVHSCPIIEFYLEIKLSNLIRSKTKPRPNLISIINFFPFLPATFTPPYISVYQIYLPLSTLFSCTFRLHLARWKRANCTHLDSSITDASCGSPLEIRLGTVRFKVDIRQPGFLLKLAANASRRLKLITGGVGEGGPRGWVGNGWKRETRWLRWRRVMLRVCKGWAAPWYRRGCTV